MVRAIGTNDARVFIDGNPLSAEEGIECSVADLDARSISSESVNQAVAISYVRLMNDREWLMKISAGERLKLLLALGPDVLRTAKRIAETLDAEGTAPAPQWRELLSTLHRQHSDVMQTPLGELFTYAILGRISKSSAGAGHPNALVKSGFRPRG